jgi:hypothetical protein
MRAGGGGGGRGGESDACSAPAHSRLVADPASGAAVKLAIDAMADKAAAAAAKAKGNDALAAKRFDEAIAHYTEVSFSRAAVGRPPS